MEERTLAGQPVVPLSRRVMTMMHLLMSMVIHNYIHHFCSIFFPFFFLLEVSIYTAWHEVSFYRLKSFSSNSAKEW